VKEKIEMTKNDNCPTCAAPLRADTPKDASPEHAPTARSQSADGGETAAGEGPDQRNEHRDGDTERHGAATKSERSSLALWGLLLPFLAIGLSIPAAIMMSLLRGAGEGGSWSYLAATVPAVAALAVLTGPVLSIVALVKIQRSKGKLRGRWMAVAGVLVPVLFCVSVSGLVFLSA
jgi:hypothetical protein